MQITSTRINSLQSSARTPVNQTAAPQPESVTDSVTFGHNSAGDVAMMAGVGFVPVAGAIVNMTALIGAGSSGMEGLAWMNLAGAGANVAGTLSLAGGLIFGNSTASYVGLGLLGSSAVSAAVTTAAL